MKGRIALCAVICYAVTLAGCATEKMIEAKQPGPPVWVETVPPDTADSKVFVGQALADNILDERAARNRALEDAAHQIAASLRSTVVSDAVDIVKKKGAEHLGQDIPDASYYSTVANKVNQAMSGVRLDAYYWEKWKIRRCCLSGGFTKYKYWVKVHMATADYERLQQALTNAIAAEIEREAQ